MKKDLYISAGFLVVIQTYAFYLSATSGVDHGFEYGCIAKSLLRGEGFSDPFCSVFGNSGPTAWMPPFLSYLQAFVFSVFGMDSTVSTWVMLSIANISIAFTLFLLLRLAAEVSNKYRHLCVLVFTGYILANRFSFLVSFHDIWLVSLISIAIPYVLYFHFVKRSISAVPVIILALSLPLISPIAAFAFVCVVAWLFLNDFYTNWKNNKKEGSLLESQYPAVAKLFVIAFAFALPVMLWGLRNYITFNQFIPIKSNMWFDFYQANVYDRDGLITDFTFSNFHPTKNKTRLIEYQTIGELALMDSLKEESVTYVKANPSVYLGKIKNRFISAFVYTKHPIDEKQKLAEKAVSASDLVLLKKHRVVSASNAYNMQMDEETFRSVIELPGIEDKAKITRLWQGAVAEYGKELRSPVRIVKMLLLSGIPFMAWLISLCLIRPYKPEVKKLFVIVSIFYFSFLLPYIIISIYTRYQLPLAPVFSLLIYFATVMLLNKFLKPRSAYLSMTLPEDQQEAADQDSVKVI